MKYLLLLLAMIGLSSPAFAVCLGLSLQTVPSTSTFQGSSGEYHVFDPTEYMQTVNMTIHGGASIGTCTYFITLSPGLSGNPAQRKLDRGGTRINYNVYTTAAKTNILKDTNTAGSASEVLVGTFPNGLNQTTNKSFYWTISPAGQVVTSSATQFKDTSLDVKLYEGILGLYVLADTKTITFQSRAESSVDLSLVDDTSAFNSGDTTQTIDFASLISGESLSYDTIIRSNDGYRVTFQSQNAQVMKHQNAPTVATTVPYTLTFGGAAVNLSGGGAVQVAASSGTATSAAGQRFSTAFTVGTLTGAEAAGNYQDVITVTVAAH